MSSHHNTPWARVQRGLVDHPGVPVLAWLVFLGFLAGLGGTRAWWIGPVVMLGLYGPWVLYSAWEHGAR